MTEATLLIASSALLSLVRKKVTKPNQTKQLNKQNTEPKKKRQVPRLARYLTSYGPGTRFSVSRKAPETFRTHKSILVHLYLKAEKCIRLNSKLLVWSEPLLILIICE